MEEILGDHVSTDVTSFNHGNIDSYNISFGKAKRKDSSMKILLLDNRKSVKNLRFEENISLDSGILDYLK